MVKRRVIESITLPLLSTVPELCIKRRVIESIKSSSSFAVNSVS